MFHLVLMMWNLRMMWLLTWMMAVGTTAFQLSTTTLSSSRLKAAAVEPQFAWPDEISAERPLRVIIAGAGVGGLTLANALRNVKHVDVQIVEKTSSFRRFGGPIQLASNAMQLMKTIDEGMFEEIAQKFTWTGNLTNGIKDGVRDEWYAKFDLKTPAVDRKMPFTGVIERPELQAILLDHLDERTIVHNGKAVAKYAQECDLDEQTCPVVVEMSDGSLMGADVLIGADGIWSEVRASMRNEPARGEGSGVAYSGYTVFAGELDYASPDEGDVGYKVYIGPGQYFVITNIGPKRYQWYAFLARPAGSSYENYGAYLKGIFDGWSPDVHAILDATRDDEIEQRDLYDRPPSVLGPWTEGPVGLLGDSIHAMMPNLGQGGCQAIEDAVVLAEELDDISKRSQVTDALVKYRDRRLIRSAAVQGLSRFASDIIIRGFDTPAKIVNENGAVRFENFGYAGIVTRLMQPILPVFFTVQFNFLYDGWQNKSIDIKAGLAIAAFGLLLLALAAGAVGDLAVLLPFLDITAFAELGATISETVGQVLPSFDGIF